MSTDDELVEGPVDEEHVLVYEPDHPGRATELLLWQDRDKVRIRAFVRALAKGAQLLENTQFAVLIGATTIAGSEGVNLDRWGSMVGEFRGGLPDEETYRKFIALRIRVNGEFPNEDAMWSVLQEAVEPSVVTSYPVADGIVYLVASPLLLDPSVAAHAAALIRDFRPAATYAPIIEYGPGHFGHDGEAGAPPLTDGTGTAVLAELLYSGRSR